MKIKKASVVKTALSSAWTTLTILAVCSALSFSGCAAPRNYDNESDISKAMKKRGDGYNDDSNRETGTKAGFDAERDDRNDLRKK